MLFGNSETSDCIDSLKCLHISILFSRMLGIHVVFAKIRTMHLIFYTKKYLCIFEGSFVYIQKLQIQKYFTIFDEIQSSLLKKRLSQPGFTIPKLRMKTLEQSVNGVVLVSLLLTLKIFSTLF